MDHTGFNKNKRPLAGRDDWASLAQEKKAALLLLLYSPIDKKVSPKPAMAEMLLLETLLPTL